MKRSTRPSSTARCRPSAVALFLGASAFAGMALTAAAALSCAGAAHAAGEPSAGELTSAAPQAAVEPAHWVKKKIYFAYQGFTTHYSCEGLRDKVRDVLLQLGARKSGLDVHEIGCSTGIGRPDPFPSVGGTFYVLEPGSTSAESAGAAPVQAAWQTVTLRVARSQLGESGQCELIDQVRTRILPLFAVRDVKFRPSCIPHQLEASGSALTADVLKPIAGSDAVARAAH